MILDAHAHLFSRAYYAGLWTQKYGAESKPTDANLRAILDPAGIELPPADPAAHAARWIAEMDVHGIDRMTLFTSLPGEQESVAQAVRAFPDRLVGFTMVNPRAPGALDTLKRDLDEFGMRGLELFPAMHRFDPSDEELLYPIYELATQRRALVFCHVGLLVVKMCALFGLPSPFDARYGNPLLLDRAAGDHPKLNFIIPHFGAGFLREAALLGHARPNVYIDTSSSNAWMDMSPEDLGMPRAVQACINAVGAERILYGSDSSVFPRGYRFDLLRKLDRAFADIDLDAESRAMILGRNYAGLLGV